MSISPQTAAVVLVSLLVQLVLFLRWLHRRMRDEEIQRAFIRDMAVNHLPHIYSALQQIIDRCPAFADMRDRECPIVKFVDLEENAKGRG